MSSLGVWLKELLSRERRGAERRNSTSLVAYFWDGGAPAAHAIRDVSTAGLYLLTPHRWYPGTMIEMTLQKKGVLNNEKDRAIKITAKVIRHGADGVGFAFVLPHNSGFDGSKKVDMTALKRFLR
jgi:PilZ domain-containing protein